MAAGAGYAENLRKLATFRTLEEFWGVYTHLLRADELPKDSNYHVFREGIRLYPSFHFHPCFVSLLQRQPVATYFSSNLPSLSGYLPMWESFPFGGCWIIRVRLLPPIPHTRATFPQSIATRCCSSRVETESDVARPVAWFQ
jgi:hypothetical protein